jgi:hypothetical protein
MSNHYCSGEAALSRHHSVLCQAEVEVEAANEEQAEEEGYEKIQDFDEAFGDKAFGGAEHWWFTMHDATVERA